jgi:hypothetical protein
MHAQSLKKPAVFENVYLLRNQKIEPPIMRIAEIEIHNQLFVLVSNVAPVIKAPIEPVNNPIPCF